MTDIDTDASLLAMGIAPEQVPEINCAFEVLESSQFENLLDTEVTELLSLNDPSQGDRFSLQRSGSFDILRGFGLLNSNSAPLISVEDTENKEQGPCFKPVPPMLSRQSTKDFLRDLLGDVNRLDVPPTSEVLSPSPSFLKRQPSFNFLLQDIKSIVGGDSSAPGEVTTPKKPTSSLQAPSSLKRQASVQLLKDVLDDKSAVDSPVKGDMRATLKRQASMDILRGLVAKPAKVARTTLGSVSDNSSLSVPVHPMKRQASFQTLLNDLLPDSLPVSQPTETEDASPALIQSRVFSNGVSNGTKKKNPSRRKRNNGAATNPALAADRKHVCTLCDARFLCKSKLDRHMLTHTGAKPFSCFCGKSFNQKSALKNHSRRHIRKGEIPEDVLIREGLNGFTYAALKEHL